MNFNIKEEQLEDALESARKNRQLYTALMITLFLVGNTCTYTALTNTPFFFIEPQYLCKGINSDKYDSRCSKDFICSRDSFEGSDYIIDPEHNLKTFVSAFGLYCSKSKSIAFSSLYFIGGLIGICILPPLISLTGCLNLIIIGYGIFFLACCFISFIENYIMGMIMYCLMSLGFTFHITAVPQYIIEMISPKWRGLFIAINFISFGTSGYLGILVNYFLNNYQYVTGICGGICLLVAILMKLFLVDSIRTSFVQGKLNEINKSLEYIAKVNTSTLEYKVWKEQNIINQSDNPDTAINSNKFKLISFISIWKYASQIRIIIIFSLSSFIWQFLVLLIQYESRKTDRLYEDLAITYTSDLIGVMLGYLATEIPFFQRRYSFFFSISSIFLSFLISGIFYVSHSLTLQFILRLFIFGLQTINTVYNFEIYPTMTRPIGISINRIFSRLFNLGTPYLIIAFPRECYFICAGIALIICVLICILPLDETKNQIIKEYPPEYNRAIIVERVDEDEDVLEKINKEK